ncbi:hypothetical protein ST47_g917 [Ascochyta rabiei]|uniref:Uncharacterized protein n=2 Tax=Didymella rabiei TaxID=5454 RepID=A0A163LNH6_DIDRA|nr:hypothetical protein ST47_g917 [Ascochyta rabiei]
MKSLVVGAMLLHTMNAQGLAGVPAAAAAPAAALPAVLPAVGVPVAPLNAPAVNAPAPLITPGIDAPSEADLLGLLPSIALPPILGPSRKLPTGTADVIVDQPTSAVPFGAESTPGPGISFGPNGWSVPNADVASANIAAPSPLLARPSVPAALANAVAAIASPLAPLRSLIPAIPIRPTGSPAQPLPAAVSAIINNLPKPSPATGGFGIFAVGDPADAAPVDATPVDAAPVDAAPADAAPVDATPVDAAPVDAAPADAAPVDATPVDAAPVDAAPVDAAPAAPVDAAPAAPVDAAPAAPVDAAPVDAAPVDASPINAAPGETASVVDANPVQATPSVDPSAAPLPVGAALPIGTNPYVGPYDPNSIYDPYSPYFDPNSIYDPNSPYYDPYAAPSGWEGQDHGIYDGEDDSYYGSKRPVHNNDPSYGGDDEEECPAWCIEDDSYPSYPTSTPGYDYSPYKPTPTPKYPEYTPVADPYQQYEPTPEYSPYPAPTYAEDYPIPTPDYEPYAQESAYYPEPKDNSYPQPKKVRAVRRQAPNYPQPIYSNDDDYDGEDGSIPDWLYDISGAPKRPLPTPKPKPKCPKSCYKPKTSTYEYDYTTKPEDYATKPDRPTYTMTRKGGYNTTKEAYYPATTDDSYDSTPTDDSYYSTPTDDSYYSTPTDDGYYPDETTEAPYPGYTPSGWYSQDNTSTPLWPTSIPDEPTSIPDEPTSVPDEPTSTPDEPTSVPDEPTSVPDEPTSVPAEPTYAPAEPTTLVTQYLPQPYPEQTGGAGSDPGSPAGDYTGDSLDTLCPNVCNPFNPAENFCDITTGCTTTGGSKYYCACRAGFRADNYNAKDFSKQFRVAGQPYVYLSVSTSCNTACSDSTCSEVLERSQCK